MQIKNNPLVIIEFENKAESAFFKKQHCRAEDNQHDSET